MAFSGRIIQSSVAAATLVVVVAQAPEDYLKQASAMVARHERDQAMEILDKGLQAFPHHPDVLTQLGLLLIMTGNLQAGDELLSRALAIRPLNRRALQGRAEAKLRQGALSEATGFFERALSQRSSDADTRHRLAFTLFAQGQDQEALVQARRAVEQAPLSVPYRRLYALLLRLQGKADESRRQLRMAFSLDPTDIVTLRVLSQQEWQEGNRERAIELAEQGVRLDSENPLGHRTLHLFYKRVGRNEEAAREEKEWVKHQLAFDLYLEALREAGRGSLDQTHRLLREALQVAAEFTTAKLYLAALHSRQGEDDAALQLYSEILSEHPTQAVAVSESARIRLSQGSVDLALSTLEAGGARNENLELLRGYQAMQDREFRTALSHFERVRADNPLLPGLLQLVAYCLSELGEYEDALEKLATAARVFPARSEIDSQAAEVQFEKAQALQGQGRWRDAIGSYESLIETAGVQADYLFNLGYCHQKLGQLDQAVTQYRRALKIQPWADWTRVNLASVLYLQQKYDLSAAEWQTLINKQPSTQSFHQLGLCLSHLARHPEAERAFEKALSLGDHTPQLLYNLGVCRLRLRKVEMAWPLIKKAARAGYFPALHMVDQARRKR